MAQLCLRVASELSTDTEDAKSQPEATHPSLILGFLFQYLVVPMEVPMHRSKARMILHGSGCNGDLSEVGGGTNREIVSFRVVRARGVHV